MGNTYRSNLIMTDIMQEDTVSLIQGEWTKIGEVVVKADELIGMGYGGNSAQNMAEGRIFLDLKDNSSTPAVIKGDFRIMLQSSQDIPIGTKPVWFEVNLDILRSGSSDRNGQIPFYFENLMLSKDKKFTFWVKCSESGKTLSKANSTALIDITKQLV